MSPQKLAVAIIAVAVLAYSPDALARSIYLNGVEISSLKNHTFKNATVHIDDKGDVHINAPGYKVELVDDDAPASAPDKEGGANAALSAHYYLVTKPSPDGRAQFDFVIKINGVERKVIPAGSPQIIMEISTWLKPGENEVLITARKNMGAGRKSVSTADKAEVIIGTGHEESSIVKIDVVNGSLQVTAAQLSDSTKRIVLQAI